MSNALKKFDFNAVLGHELICSGLKQAVKNGRTVSTYLFSGPEGIGKKTVARAFASALLCEAPSSGAPCLSCSSCKLSGAETHPDLIRLRVSKDKKSIGIDIVREQVIQEAYVRPFSAGRKVFIIENSDLMTTEAQNALLKVIEEPPSYAVFLLLATDKNLLLETIRSRALKLQFLPLGQEICKSYFDTFPDVSRERRMLAASFSQGNLGKGKRMLTDDSFYQLYKDTTSALSALTEKTSSLLDMQQFFVQNKLQIEDVIDFMLVFLRDCLRRQISPAFSPICADGQAELMQFSAATDQAGLVRMSEALIQFRERLHKNASFTAAGLELLMKMQEEIHVKGSRNPI